MRVIALLLVAALVFCAGFLGQQVPFSKQWPLYEALRTTASIIFAVVGAWFAIIYPERLRISFRGGASDSIKQDGGIHRLFTPIVHSTCILSIILLVGVVAPLVKTFPFVAPYINELRGLSYGLLVSLTLWQLVTVISSLIGPDILKSHADHEDRTEETLNGFTKLHQKQRRE